MISCFTAVSSGTCQSYLRDSLSVGPAAADRSLKAPLGQPSEGTAGPVAVADRISRYHARGQARMAGGIVRLSPIPAGAGNLFSILSEFRQKPEIAHRRPPVQ